MTALPLSVIRRHVKAALAEDLYNGDVTSSAIFNADHGMQASIVMREDGILCGIGLAEETFDQVNSDITYERLAEEGEKLKAGGAVLSIEGPAADILAAERTALNFLTHLSGIASLTGRYVEAVSHTQARICCTRKTLAHNRDLQKYAVRMGGGINHRYSLGDAVLIKDNHIAAAGSIIKALEAVKHGAGPLLSIGIEVDNLIQFEEVLACRIANHILLDNFTPQDTKKAVAMKAGEVTLEASGGITLSNVKDYAETGVDFISSGALTHSAPALDIALDVTL